jgi:tripartite-type tricarboxylate transporter receptor subunit TctC
MNRLNKTWATLALACAGAASLPLVAQAQGYPAQPVRMIVAFAAGGPTDVLARIVATGMSRSLGQQVIVDNRGGAGGILGTKETAKAKPDGYTVLFAGDATLTVQPQLSKNAGYDGLKDFTPIRIISSQSNVLVVNQSKGYKDVKDLIAKAKAKPGSVTFGSAGNGSPSHLIGALFESATQVNLSHIPYKGAGPAMIDLIGGQVDLMFVGMPVAKQNANRPELKLLATTGAARASALPDVPTFAEAGVSGLGADTAVWWGLVAPAGLPADVKTRLDTAMQAALKDPEVLKGLAEQGVDVIDRDGATMGQWIARDQAKWRKLIAEQKITTD